MFASGGGGELRPLFIAGLIIAIIGAVTVLVFAPRGQPHGHPPAPSPKPADKAQEAAKA
jgi:hypothetical protein